MIQTSIEPLSFALLDGRASRVALVVRSAAAGRHDGREHSAATATLNFLIPSLLSTAGGGMIDASPVRRRRRRTAAAIVAAGAFLPAQRRAQLRHQPVPVPAIHGPDELHHLPSLALRGPLEEERGRVHGHAEQLGLLRAGHGRFDRLDARGDDDAP